MAQACQLPQGNHRVEDERAGLAQTAHWVRVHRRVLLLTAVLDPSGEPLGAVVFRATGRRPVRSARGLTDDPAVRDYLFKRSAGTS